MATFNDLLSRADNLKEKVVPTTPHSTQKVPNAEVNDLRSIFRASDEIWKRKQLRSDLQWKPRDAVTGALPKSSLRTESHAKPTESTAPLNQSTSAVFNDYIKRSAERARIEAERAFINQHILEQSHFSTAQKMSSEKTKLPFMGGNKSLTNPHASMMLDSQSNELAIEILAKHLSKLLSKTCTRSIDSAVKDALEEIAEVDSSKLWRKVFALCENGRYTESSSPSDYRNSDHWKHYVIEQATSLLQQTFKDYMNSVIQNNLQAAQRGGVPGTMSLIEAYLNVCLNNRFQYQDGTYGKHPIWPILFLSLRLGDFNFAAKVASSLQNLSNCSILIKILASFNTTHLVDGDKRFRLNAEWNHVMSTCQDPYKNAVYAMILGHECPEVNNTIENWLWSRLMYCKLDPVNGIGHFYKLQTTICVDFGEDYFVGDGGNHALYFTVLWLTGQLERAIDLLFRAEQRHHAVHIAILAYQHGLLNIVTHSSMPILSYDQKDPIFCLLNLSRLILLYVKNFELTNLDYTLSYCFFLRNMDFERDGGLKGGNIFEACVSRLCFISDKVDAILGRMSETGDRISGLIDKFASQVDVYKVVARVAKDFDIYGDSLTACRLYILSGHPNDSLKICSKQLATYLTTAHEKTNENVKQLEDIVSLGSWLEKRYQQRPEPELQETYLAELSTLLKLSTFYSTAANGPDEAFSIMKSLNLLPLTNDELASRVANFSSLPEQVRLVLPDIVLLLMETLFKLYKESVTSQSKRIFYRNCSNVLLLYVAQINLRFPVEINSKLLQLQSHIN